MPLNFCGCKDHSKSRTKRLTVVVHDVPTCGGIIESGDRRKTCQCGEPRAELYREEADGTMTLVGCLRCENPFAERRRG